MASTSASRDFSATGRIRNAPSILCSDTQSVVSDIRKALSLIKEVSIDLEKENQFKMVKELEDGFIELLEGLDDHMHFSSAVESVCGSYQPGAELTDFKTLLEDEAAKLKNGTSTVQGDSLLRQLRLAVWNVHHAGQPLPGEELEDIVITDTQSNLLNVVCPLTGKPITELVNPVRSMDCKHIYGKEAIMAYVNVSSKAPPKQCPVTGCPKALDAERIMCDPLLLVEIDELRTMSTQTVRPGVVEDFTELDEDEK